jgi:hypothetical protein
MRALRVLLTEYLTAQGGYSVTTKLDLVSSQMMLRDAQAMLSNMKIMLRLCSVSTQVGLSERSGYA